MIQAALDRVGTDPTPTRARLLAALVAAHDAALEWSNRRDLSIEALDVARQSGDDPTFVEVLEITLYNQASPDHRDQLVTDIERAVAIADRVNDPVLQARIRPPLIWARYQQADITGAEAVAAELEALTEQVGLPQQHFQHALVVTGGLLRAGRLDEADAANERALELGLAANTPEAFGAYGGYLYAIRLQQGRLDEIADLFIDAARDNPSIAVLRAAVAAMLTHLGRLDEANERLRAEAAADFDFPYDMTWLGSMSDLLDAAAATGNQTAARALVDRVAPFAAHLAETTAALLSGVIARPLARAATLLGDYDQAEEWFAMAHEIHARLHAPFWTALGQLDHADLCLARRADGDVERARELATTAAATAAEYGCAGLTKRAEELLAGL